MNRNSGAMRYIKLHNTQMINIWKAMTAKIVKNLISGSQDTASHAVVHYAELVILCDKWKRDVNAAHRKLDEKLQNLTQNDWLNKIIGLPARLLAITLIYTLSLAVLITIIALATCLMVLETIGACAFTLGVALKDVGNVVKSATVAIYTASRDGIDKFLSERQQANRNSEQSEEESENTKKKNEFVAKALGYVIAGIAATLMVCVVFPIALLSALVSIVPAAYVFNKSECFRDEVADALVLDKSYNNVKSVRDLVYMPQVSEPLRDNAKFQISRDLEKMSAEYLGEVYRDTQLNRLEWLGRRNA